MLLVELPGWNYREHKLNGKEFVAIAFKNLTSIDDTVKWGEIEDNLLDAFANYDYVGKFATEQTEEGFSETLVFWVPSNTMAMNADYWYAKQSSCGIAQQVTGSDET